MHTPTLVTVLLDKSGSMESIRDDTIGGFNSYLRGLQEDTETPFLLTLVQFDSMGFEKTATGLPVTEVAPLTRQTYVPRGSTPLLDALYTTIKATEHVLRDRSDITKVLFVVQTDGQENCSTEHLYADVMALVTERTQVGWEFVFLGAGIDAFSAASRLGIDAHNTVSYSRARSREVFQALYNNTRAYGATGQSVSVAFNSAQRESVGEAYTSPVVPAAHSSLGGSLDLTIAKKADA